MTEKKIELRKVPCGETFTAFRDAFVVLEQVDGGVLSICKRIWKRAPFDNYTNNNLKGASILHTIKEYVQLLKSNGAHDGAFLPLHIDLKATDGSRDYGYCDCDVGLLTLEQYGKYKDIIPLDDGWWWLATPWLTRRPRFPHTNDSTHTWYVNSNGGYNYDGAYNFYGVRPVLSFAPCLMVSLGDDEAERAVQAKEEARAKEEAWDAYHEYLYDWMEENVDESHYGSSPLSFEAWMKDLHETGV